MSRRFLWCLLAAIVPVLTWAAVAVPPPNLHRALEVQRDLVARSPNDARALNDLGNLLMLAGDLQAAESAYRRALEIEPGKASARYNLALLLQQLDRRKEAFKQLRLLVTEHPDYAWGWYQIGSLYDLAEQKNKAVESYARAFRLDPQLAFPEVNPHVIDNRFFTEALIKSSPGGSAGSMAPKAYDEPARITGILVPPPPIDGEEGPVETTAAEVAETGEEFAGPGDGRSLSEGDLDAEGGVNQIQGGSAGRGRSTRSRSPVTRTPSTSTRGAGVPRFRSPQRGTAPNGGRDVGSQVQGTAENPQRGQGAESEDGAGVDQPNGSRPLTTPRGRVRYRPGTDSTGSLGIDLVPSADGEVPAE